jgi:hypothetical protein
VPLRTWRESYTCPGAEQERRRLADDGVDLRDFDERWEDRRRSRAYGEVFQAAQAKAAGQGRDEIREIYLAELNARGLKKPSDTVLTRSSIASAAIRSRRSASQRKAWSR